MSRDYFTTEERVANALERIADALEESVKAGRPSQAKVPE